MLINRMPTPTTGSATAASTTDPRRCASAANSTTPEPAKSAPTYVTLLVQNLKVRKVHVVTGELLRELELAQNGTTSHANEEHPSPLPRVRVSPISCKIPYVGMTGFEPATSPPQTARATKLRYIP